jgi:glycosyltransferase involved in cell wall biosynthesis
MKFQIMIPTMPGRAKMLRRLLDVLEPQLARWPQAAYFTDAGEGTIGEKRQRMMEAATGEYIAFVDDDDLVAPDYLDRIMPLLEKGPDTVGIAIHVKMEGKPWGPDPIFRHSLQNKWNVKWEGNQRTPHHLCPLRRTVALRGRFLSLMWGEDYDYAVGILPHLQTEEWSGDEPIYFYEYWSGKPFDSEA